MATTSFNTTTANSTPAFPQPTGPQMISQDQLMGSLQGKTITTPQVSTTNLPGTSPFPAPTTNPTTAYSPTTGVSTQKVADATYNSAITNAVANTSSVPSTATGGSMTPATAGAQRTTAEALLQQYLDQQKAYQDKYLAANTPSAAETAAASNLNNLKTTAALNQEKALASGETSSFAGGEAQRVARTDAIKIAGASAELQQLQSQREGAVKDIEFLINSGDKSFATQLKIQELQSQVSGIDKQTQDTYFNIAQSEGIDLPYDPTKTATENLSALQKARATKKEVASQEFTPRQQTLFNSLVQQANKSPLIEAADRAVILRDSIDNARKAPTEGYVQRNLAYSYVQALDTYQSAVREGELKDVVNVDSFAGKLESAVLKINNGIFAREEVIKEMADAAELLYSSIAGAAKQKDESFKAQAEVLGIGEYWDAYRGNFQRSYEGGATQQQTYEGPDGKKYDNPDDYMISWGYSQEEIDAAKKKYNYQGFNPVGSGTNSATQNLTSDFGNMQGLLQKARPLEMTNESSSQMSGLMKPSALPVLQRLSIEIPRTSRLSFVNNNPGNLKFAGQDGAVKGEGGFAKFTSPQAGFNALINQIKLEVKRGHTLASFVNKFAPPSENDTKLYIQQATKALGFNSGTPLKNIPIEELAKFVAQKESSTKIN